MLAGLLLMPAAGQAWYQPYPVPSGYRGWSQPHPAWGGNYHGYTGYGQPRWAIRGRISPYGDYRFDVKLRGVSKYDIYKAWLLYNYYSYQ